VRCVKKLMICVASLGLVSRLWAASDREATNDRPDHAGSGISEIMVAPVTGIPEKVWSTQNASPWCRICSRVAFHSARRTEAA
jgi:hypothetical protein